MSTPDFIVIGHLARDEHDGRPTLGGTATYAGMTAHNLGYRTGILTRAAEDFPQPELLEGIEVLRLPSPTTTTFTNIYDAKGRQQFVRDVADPIGVEQLPPEWRAPRIALLGPIAGEVDSEMVKQFDAASLIGVTPQGWMRRWDANGRVKARSWNEAPDILPHARVLVLSEEDLGEFTERMQAYCSLTPIVVLTRGDMGCYVYRGKGRPLVSPAFKTTQVDPTGA
ncbi:MAG: PfkB family carbohydrate kinase, partial [Anaerolineae bacterium]